MLNKGDSSREQLLKGHVVGGLCIAFELDLRGLGGEGISPVSSLGPCLKLGHAEAWTRSAVLTLFALEAPCAGLTPPSIALVNRAAPGLQN